MTWVPVHPTLSLVASGESGTGVAQNRYKHVHRLKAINFPHPGVSCIFIKYLQDYFQLDLMILIYRENNISNQ